MRTTLRSALVLAAVLAAAPASAGPAPRPLDQAALKKGVAGLKGAFTACVNRAASKGQGKVAARKATLRLTVLPTPSELAEPPVEPSCRAVRAGRPQVDEAADAQAKVMTIDGVDDARVELVWDPAWNQEMISEEGKMKLGMI